MDEEKQQGENKTAENTGEGNQPKTPKVIDDSNKAAERLEEANAKREALLEREEALAAHKQLSGEAEAGITPKKLTEDEKWAEDAKKRYAGTGLDPTDDETPTTYG